MRRFTLVAVAGLALAAAWAVPAWAAGKRVKREEVPQACLDAVTKRLPNARLTSYRKVELDKEVSYLITARSGRRSVTFSLSPEGKVLLQREKVAQQDLPDAVKAGLAASRHAQGKVLRVWRIISEEKEDDPSFEMWVNTEGHRYEVTFDKEGRMTKETERKARPARKKAAHTGD